MSSNDNLSQRTQQKFKRSKEREYLILSILGSIGALISADIWQGLGGLALATLFLIVASVSAISFWVSRFNILEASQPEVDQ